MLELVQKIVIVNQIKIQKKKGAANHTPLGIACNFGFLDIVNLLLENGADKNIKSDGYNLITVTKNGTLNKQNISNIVALLEK